MKLTPGKRQSYAPRACQECGEQFQPKRVDQVFCRNQCKFDAKNRAFKRGVEAYRAVYHLVTVTGAKARGLALVELTQKAREWRDEDRKLGRPSPSLPALLEAERHREAVRKRYAEAGLANCPY